jgi:hypothetical protein
VLPPFNQIMTLCLVELCLLQVTGWVDPRHWNEHHYSPSGSSNELTYVVLAHLYGHLFLTSSGRYTITRIAIAIQVVFAGIALPHKYVKIEARSLAVLLVGYMTAGWLTCGLFIVRLHTMT